VVLVQSTVVGAKTQKMHGGHESSKQHAWKMRDACEHPVSWSGLGLLRGL